MAENTEDIDFIRNYPKKAINKLALPIIISNLFMNLNNIVDGVWVAGLGSNALAAIGFVTPLFFALVGLANGIGAGSNSLIARYLGAEDYFEANNSAIHSVVLSLIITIIMTILLLIFLKPLLLLFGAGEVINESVSYASIIVLGSFSIFVPVMFSAIFRSQGEINRATMPLIAMAIINMILDPIFIYTFNWGVSGAAMATTLAATLSLVPMLYWSFIKKDSFLKINLKEYKTKLSIYKDILFVGIPASLEQLIISFVSIIMNYWLAILSGTLAVAAYTSAWRLINIGVTPAIGVGIAAITVGGAAYGAKNYKNMKIALNYSIKLGLILSICVCAFFLLFANQLAYLFSYSSASSTLLPLIVNVIYILGFFIVPMPVGATAGNIFQSMGKGGISLGLTIIRTLMSEVFFAWLLAFVFNLGETGIYAGMVIGMTFGCVISYIYINHYLNKIKPYFTDT